MNAMQTLVIPTDAPTVFGPPQGKWTAADWEQLPFDYSIRYEIIDGYLYASGIPSTFHQWIIGGLIEYVDSDAVYAVQGPLGVILSEYTAVQPDYVVVVKERAHIIRYYVNGSPDMIIEVMYPGNPEYDEGVKLRAYANAGVPEYVIVNPANRTLTHYRLTEPGHYEKVGTFAESDTVTFDCLPSISLHVGSLFAGAPDTTL